MPFMPEWFGFCGKRFRSTSVRTRLAIQSFLFVNGESTNRFILEPDVREAHKVTARQGV
jgi:hypothetical protein